MGARLKFWRRSRVSKQGSRDEAVEILFLAAPPSNLNRLYYNGSAAKSHSTTTQNRQVRRLVTYVFTVLVKLDIHFLGLP